MLTRLENTLRYQRYEKWKVGEKLGSNAHPCYIRIRVITNRVISKFKCINQTEKYLQTVCLKPFQMSGDMSGSLVIKK